MKFQTDEKQLTIAVCAREDSLQLRKLISSLLLQTTPEKWKVRDLVVVVNGSEKANSEIRSFADAVTASENSVTVLFETRKGIPFARNAALDFAEGVGSEWIAFIDDDCLPNHEWLYRLCLACDQTGSDGAAGSWSISAAEKPSRWIPDDCWGEKHYNLRGKQVGNLGNLETAYTRSVLFRISPAIDSDGNSDPLRFDVRHASRGGSDVIFFNEYIRAGNSLVYATGSRVEETYRNERLRLRWHLKQKIRNTQLILEREVLHARPSAAWRFTSFVDGLTKSLLSLFTESSDSRGHRGLRQALGNVLLNAVPLIAVSLEVLGFRYHAYSDSWKFLR